MLDRLWRHLSFANVLSLTALFIALGGGAYAASRVGSAGGADLQSASSSSAGSCPHNATKRVGDVCFGRSFSGTSWHTAVDTCRNQNLRLPDIAETWLVFRRAPAGRTWTDEIADSGDIIVRARANGDIQVTVQPGTALVPYYCVSTPWR